MGKKINENNNKESEGVNMEAVLDERKGYRKLDMSKLKFTDEIISMEEALKDVLPIDWPDDVLTGKKKVVVKNAEKDERKKCVKLEISC